MNEKYGAIISVVMPVYNAEKDLAAQAIKSILEQDYKNLELIIVEDPSSKNITSTIASFNDPRIIYLLNPQRTSFAEQINRGIHLGKGAFIARMDADDMAEPCRLSLQYEFMKTHPEISVVGSNLKIMMNSEVIGLRFYPETHEKIAHQMKLGSAVAHPSVIFRKKDVLEVGGFLPEFGVVADYDLWCRMLLAGKIFYNYQQPLIRYRIHAQASKMTSLKKTLGATLEIKKRYFKGKKDIWGVQASTRYNLERFLMFMPSRLIFKLFIAASIKRF
jgi:glycosyltransferase involved in cell wall biosynthesis